MPECKPLVVETIRQAGQSCRETARQFAVPSDTVAAFWERIYPAEGAEGLRVERRGRGSKGRPASLPSKEEDLLAKAQRLTKACKLLYLQEFEDIGQHRTIGQG